MSSDLVPWDTRLCFDVALGIDSLEDILTRYAIEPAAFAQWSAHPLFSRTVAEFQKHIRENGLSFRAKARMQAEDLLGVAYGLVQDTKTPAPVRADLIKWIAKMGELEPAQGPAGGSEKITRDAMSRMLQKMDDGELELRVMQIVSKKGVSTSGEGNSSTLEGEVIERS